MAPAEIRRELMHQHGDVAHHSGEAPNSGALPEHNIRLPIWFPDDLPFKSHLTGLRICPTLDRNGRTPTADASLTADPRSD